MLEAPVKLMFFHSPSWNAMGFKFYENLHQLLLRFGMSQHFSVRCPGEALFGKLFMSTGGSRWIRIWIFYRSRFLSPQCSSASLIRNSVNSKEFYLVFLFFGLTGTHLYKDFWGFDSEGDCNFWWHWLSLMLRGKQFGRSRAICLWMIKSCF